MLTESGVACSKILVGRSGGDNNGHQQTLESIHLYVVAI